MPVGTPLSITWPSQGDTDWWTKLRENVLEVMADHIEAAVTPVGIDINQDLTVGNNALTNVGHVAFTAQDASPSVNGSVYFSDGEFYITDGSGNDIQVTDGGGLNATTTNGISNVAGGVGYGSGPAVVWDSPNATFLFKEDTGTDDYAPVRASAFEINDGSGNTLSLTTPSLGSDYSIQFPNAVPAANSIMAINTSGVISYLSDVASGANSLCLHYNGSTYAFRPATVGVHTVVMGPAAGLPVQLWDGLNYSAWFRSGNSWRISAAAVSAGNSVYNLSFPVDRFGLAGLSSVSAACTVYGTTSAASGVAIRARLITSDRVAGTTVNTQTDSSAEVGAGDFTRTVTQTLTVNNTHTLLVDFASGTLTANVDIHAVRIVYTIT